MKAIVFILLSMTTYIAAAPLVPVNFYVMSKCPYAAQWVEAFTQTVLNQGLGPIIDLSMDYIAQVNASEPTGFFSKHGQSEVIGDFTELCVMTMTDDWFEFVGCMDYDYEEIPEPTQNCSNFIGISYNDVTNCVADTKFVDQALTASINRTNSLGFVPRPGSPTIYVGGKCIYGLPPCQELDPTTTQVHDYICKLYKGSPKPASCSSVVDTEPIIGQAYVDLS